MMVLIFHQGHHSAWQKRLCENQAEQSIVSNTHMIGQRDLVETMYLRKTERRAPRSSLLRKMERSVFEKATIHRFSIYQLLYRNTK